RPTAPLRNKAVAPSAYAHATTTPQQATRSSTPTSKPLSCPAPPRLQPQPHRPLQPLLRRPRRPPPLPQAPIRRLARKQTTTSTTFKQALCTSTISITTSSPCIASTFHRYLMAS